MEDTPRTRAKKASVFSKGGLKKKVAEEKANAEAVLASAREIATSPRPGRAAADRAAGELGCSAALASKVVKGLESGMSPIELEELSPDQLRTELRQRIDKEQEKSGSVLSAFLGSDKARAPRPGGGRGRGRWT